MPQSVHEAAQKRIKFKGKLATITLLMKKLLNISSHTDSSNFWRFSWKGLSSQSLGCGTNKCHIHSAEEQTFIANVCQQRQRHLKVVRHSQNYNK